MNVDAVSALAHAQDAYTFTRIRTTSERLNRAESKAMGATDHELAPHQAAVTRGTGGDLLGTDGEPLGSGGRVHGLRDECAQGWAHATGQDGLQDRAVCLAGQLGVTT